jgi:hypothetical protein
MELEVTSLEMLPCDEPEGLLPCELTCHSGTCQYSCNLTD